MPEIPHPDTLDFILEYTKNSPKRQLDAAHAIDSKGLQVFAAASIVIGLAAAGPLRNGAAAWIYGAGLFVYLAAAAAAFVVVRTRDFRVVDDADHIWPDYWNLELEKVKHALVDDITSAYSANAALLKAKAKALRVLVVATATEVMLVGTAVIASLA